jgi:SAM-dependent MidA family methyltransferase
LKNHDILAYLAKRKIMLYEKQRYEVPLKMIQEYEEIAAHLQLGILLTIDYGYTEQEWQEQVHQQGSLRGYYQHRMVGNVLNHPGEMDLTAHVHFDLLIEQGEKSGLGAGSLLQQTDFLLKAGILEELEDHQEPDPFSGQAKRNRAIRSLIVPGGHSEYFRVLLHTRNVDEKMSLFSE